MLREFRSSARLFLVMTLLTGGLYPLGVWIVARVAFPARAAGSLVVDGERARGSRLVGQPFAGEQWFWGRPSATSPPYGAARSGGSNLGPTNPALADEVRGRAQRLAATARNARPIPVDLVTASGSGLDPHVCPAAAYFQVERIAAARALPFDRVRALVEAHVERPTLGILGEARVNVLELNLALERLR